MPSVTVPFPPGRLLARLGLANQLSSLQSDRNGKYNCASGLYPWIDADADSMSLPGAITQGSLSSGLQKQIERPGFGFSLTTARGVTCRRHGRGAAHVGTVAAPWATANVPSRRNPICCYATITTDRSDDGVVVAGEVPIRAYETRPIGGALCCVA